MRHIPEVTRLARVGFPSVHAAADAVIEVLQHGVQLGAIELLDEEMAACLNSYSTNLGLPEMPCILFKFTGAGSVGSIAPLREVLGCSSRHGGLPLSGLRSYAAANALRRPQALRRTWSTTSRSSAGSRRATRPPSTCSLARTRTSQSSGGLGSTRFGRRKLLSRPPEG